MDLRQLEYFREIADTGSINEAARRMNMSQPPLSYQLKLLEEELNVRLFERSRSGVTLTEAGKLLYSRAGELLSYAGSTKQEVTRFGKKRVLRLGLTSSTVAPMMPYIAQFARENVEVNFEVHDGTTFSLFNSLMDGIIDVSVVRTPLTLENVEHTVLCHEAMIAVSSPDMCAECAGEGKVTLYSLVDRPLILYRRYEKLICDAFRAKSLEPDVFCVCDDARGAVLWASEGLATAIFPASMSSLCSSLHVQKIDELSLETEILLIWRRGKHLPTAASDFISVCTRTHGEHSNPRTDC